MLAVIIIAILLLLCIGISYYFFHVAVVRNRKVILQKSLDINLDDYNFGGPSANWMENHGYEDLFIESDDGLKLHGYFIRARQPSNKTVIIAHGYSDKGVHMQVQWTLKRMSLGWPNFLTGISILVAIVSKLCSPR